jgi:hypothetical protein
MPSRERLALVAVSSGRTTAFHPRASLCSESIPRTCHTITRTREHMRVVSTRSRVVVSTRARVVVST